MHLSSLAEASQPKKDTRMTKIAADIRIMASVVINVTPKKLEKKFRSLKIHTVTPNIADPATC